MVLSVQLLQPLSCNTCPSRRIQVLMILTFIALKCGDDIFLHLNIAIKQWLKTLLSPEACQMGSWASVEFFDSLCRGNEAAEEDHSL